MNTYSLRKLLLAFIWTVHAGFALLLFFQPHFTPKKKEHKTLVVKTITPKAPPQIHSKSVAKTSLPKKTQSTTAPAALKPQQTAKTPPAPLKKTTPPPQPQKTQPAIADKKLSKEKKSPSSQTIPEKRSKISDALLKELEESIAKIEQKTDKKTPAKTTPTTPAALQIDTSFPDVENSQEGSYIEILVGHLRQTLQLPEYGEVKIQLSLRQDGSVVKITVLRAQSRENKRYLEENLPFIRFPRFEGSFANQKESSFTLTFVNEM